MLVTGTPLYLPVAPADRPRRPARARQVPMPLRTLRRAWCLAMVASIVVAGCGDSGPLSPDAAPGTRIPAPSAAKGSGGVARSTTPISFTLAAGSCGLTTDVHATGEMKTITHLQTTNTGEVRLWFNWSAHGTAVGDDGSRYVFNYAANFKAVELTGTGAPLVIDVVDHFNLIGRGQAPDVKVFLHGLFALNAQGRPVALEGATVRGADITCDPI
jgi:hypothetical protein